MVRIGFDNDEYIKKQSEQIAERISDFGGKLYLEFGGKLFDDYHASRVLPGFKPDSKLQMLKNIANDVEIVIVISSCDIENMKIRRDIGISYDNDVLRLIDAFREFGLYVGSVVISKFNDPRIKYYINDTQIGILSNLNKCLSLCNGDYICILDGDDFFLPQKLEIQVDFLNNNIENKFIFFQIAMPSFRLT